MFRIDYIINKMIENVSSTSINLSKLKINKKIKKHK